MFACLVSWCGGMLLCGGWLWGKWGLCLWEAHRVSMEEERKQHPGGRDWLTPPYSWLVSGSFWAGGWLGATTEAQLAFCGSVSVKSHVGAGPRPLKIS